MATTRNEPGTFANATLLTVALYPIITGTAGLHRGESA
jgi:hypothetical protein